MKSRSVVIRNVKMICISVLTAAALIIICSMLSGTIRAQAAPTEPSYKYYTSIRIQKGDTLWSIAGSYMTVEYEDIDAYIREICALTHIEDSEIHYGQYITVPYYSSDYLQ